MGFCVFVCMMRKEAEANAATSQWKWCSYWNRTRITTLASDVNNTLRQDQDQDFHNFQDQDQGKTFYFKTKTKTFLVFCIKISDHSFSVNINNNNKIKKEYTGWSKKTGPLYIFPDAFAEVLAVVQYSPDGATE